MGVRDEVHNDLRELMRIGPQGRQALCQILVHRNDAVHLDSAALWRRLMGQPEHIAHNAYAAFCRLVEVRMGRRSRRSYPVRQERVY